MGAPPHRFPQTMLLLQVTEDILRAVGPVLLIQVGKDECRTWTGQKKKPQHHGGFPILQTLLKTHHQKTDLTEYRKSAFQAKLHL